MKRKDVKLEVNKMLSSGMSKKEIFETLIERGAKPSQVARFIAFYPAPKSIAQHRAKINWLVILILLCEAVGLFALAVTTKQSEVVIIVLISLSILLLILWGIYSCHATAYRVYGLLSFSQSAKHIDPLFSQHSPIAVIGFVLYIGVLIYLLYVFGKIFPYLKFFGGPLKKHGEYAFLSEEGP